MSSSCIRVGWLAPAAQQTHPSSPSALLRCCGPLPLQPSIWNMPRWPPRTPRSSASRRSTGSSTTPAKRPPLSPPPGPYFYRCSSSLAPLQTAHIVHEPDQPPRRAVGGCQSSEAKTKMVSCAHLLQASCTKSTSHVDPHAERSGVVEAQAAASSFRLPKHQYLL